MQSFWLICVLGLASVALSVSAYNPKKTAFRRHKGARILPRNERMQYAAPPLTDAALENSTLVMSDYLTPLWNLWNAIRPLPRSFVAGDYWTNCERVIKHIPDQSSCGSCWAVSSAAAFSDRLCIATKGEFQEHMSSLHLLSCCDKCQLYNATDILKTCDGGWPARAFEFIRKNGIVTGGGSTFQSPSGCKPYPLEGCARKNGVEKCPPAPTSNFRCEEKCSNKKSKHSYTDRFYAGLEGKAYRAYDETEVRYAMIDLMTNGPLVASFEIFKDFDDHDYSEVYYRKTDEIDSEEFFSAEDEFQSAEDTTWHAIRVVGWGEDENGVPYWLVANSWSEKWGDKGYFKIRRGTNECGIEQEMLGVLVNSADYRHSQ